jgi:hypothetical protein
VGKSDKGYLDCDHALRGKKRLLFCRVCEEQEEQGVSYDRMVEIVKIEKTVEDKIYPDCRPTAPKA